MNILSLPKRAYASMAFHVRLYEEIPQTCRQRKMHDVSLNFLYFVHIRCTNKRVKNFNELKLIGNIA